TLKTPPPKTAIVSGRVLDASGAPVEGATVRLTQYCCVVYDAPTPASPPPSDVVQSGSASGGSGTASSSVARPIMPVYYGDDPDPVVTGADGAFTFTTYAGPHQLTDDAKGFAETTERVTLAENETVKQDVTLEKVPPADAALEGKVVDASTGKPIEGAQVYLYNAAWGRSNWTTTDATGAFRALTLPGWTQVTVSADANRGVPIAMDDATAKIRAPDAPIPGASYYQYAHVLTLASGANALTVKLEPKPQPGVVLVGYVVDPVSKTGVPNAYVNVWNQDAGEWGGAQTDDSGSYKLLVRAGHYTINAYADGYLGSQESFVIPDGEAQHRMDVQVVKGQTRYSPCDDCYPGPIMYEKGMAAGAPTSAVAPAPPAGAESAPARDASAPAGATSTASNAPQTPTGVQAYSGSGGGLGPYHADAAGAQTQAPAPGKAVPAPAVVLVVGTLALLALALRRR